MSRPTGIVVSDADYDAIGSGFESRGRRRAASPLVWLVEEKCEAPDHPPGFSPSKLGWNRAKKYCHLPLVMSVEGEEKWEAPDSPPGYYPSKWGGTEQNCTVTCMLLKATAKDRRTSNPLQ
ncbi:hypothetical protein TNCV_1461921 [Trichonephila clavipes]|nr:hypothetical protein TNCV_1461921 [Trichonephila clavipes]